MILAAMTGFIAIFSLFIYGHHLLAFTLLLLNLLVATYLLYGKLLIRTFFEKPEFPKDLPALLLSALVSLCLYIIIFKQGAKVLEISNDEIMLSAIYLLLLSIMFLLIKIQQEEKK